MTGTPARVSRSVLPQLLAGLADLPLYDALDRLAQEVVAVAEAYRHVLVSQPHSIEDLARLVVPDEPIASFLGARRVAGELDSSLTDGWLARCVRALCLVAIADGRSGEAVAGELGAALRRLVG